MRPPKTQISFEFIGNHQRQGTWAYDIIQSMALIGVHLYPNPLAMGHESKVGLSLVALNDSI